MYADTEIELTGFTTCDGCPGGNIELTGEEMVKNGVWKPLIAPTMSDAATRASYD